MGKKERVPVAYRRLVDDDECAATRVPKGYVPMLVGSEKMERFLIHTKLLKHPCMIALLEMAALEFGYEQQGILKIPCDVGYFSQVVDEISMKK